MPSYLVCVLQHIWAASLGCALFKQKTSGAGMLQFDASYCYAFAIILANVHCGWCMWVTLQLCLTVYLIFDFWTSIRPSVYVKVSMCIYIAVVNNILFTFLIFGFILWSSWCVYFVYSILCNSLLVIRPYFWYFKLF